MSKPIATVAALLVAMTAVQPAEAQKGLDPTTIVQRMVTNEQDASFHRRLFSYISVEKSDRTGGHEWTERVVEIPEGKLRNLLLEDGKPLSPERRLREDARLRAIAKNPQAFIRRELARKRDEQRAQQMFGLLPRAFLFRYDGLDQSWERIAYWPNPSYEPHSYEERILHEMSGTILVDPHAYRLHMLQGRLAEDVSFGYGLLATLRSGSRFCVVRSPVDADQWKTTSLDVRMDGHILLFKTLNRNETFVHKDFKALRPNLTIKEAVALLLR